MLDKELEKFELREKALDAREKAARARRMAARTGNAPSTRVLELHAAEFEAKAAALDRDIEEIEEQNPLNTESVRPGIGAGAWMARQSRRNSISCRILE